MGKATHPAAARKAGRERQRASAEARAHGSHERINGIDINHGASPLTRWRSAGELDDYELAAIAWCQKRWALVGLEQRTTASYDERVAAGTAGGESGRMMLVRADARDDLKRVSGGLGPDGEYHAGYIPKAYWDIFENCIRFDEPAGVVGSRLGASAPSVRALTVVKCVAAFIAMLERLQY
jgi:hypothetical protein